MHLEPVLLETTLAAIFYWLTLALWAAVERNELLVEVVGGFYAGQF